MVTTLKRDYTKILAKAAELYNTLVCAVNGNKCFFNKQGFYLENPRDIMECLLAEGYVLVETEQEMMNMTAWELTERHNVLSK